MAKTGYHRADRVADQIRMEVADILMRKIKDPRVQSVTVTDVKLTSDLRIPSLAAYGLTAAHVPGVIEKAAQASSMKANPIVLTNEELAAVVTAATSVAAALDALAAFSPGVAGLTVAHDLALAGHGVRHLRDLEARDRTEFGAEERAHEAGLASACLSEQELMVSGDDAVENISGMRLEDVLLFFGDLEQMFFAEFLGVMDRNPFAMEFEDVGWRRRAFEEGGIEDAM